MRMALIQARHSYTQTPWADRFKVLFIALQRDLSFEVCVLERVL